MMELVFTFYFSVSLILTALEINNLRALEKSAYVRKLSWVNKHSKIEYYSCLVAYFLLLIQLWSEFHVVLIVLIIIAFLKEFLTRALKKDLIDFETNPIEYTKNQGKPDYLHYITGCATMELTIMALTLLYIIIY